MLMQIVLILTQHHFAVVCAKSIDHQQRWQGKDWERENVNSHSCIHDEIVEQRRKPGRQVYSVTSQVYMESEGITHNGRALLSVSDYVEHPKDAKLPIRIYLNYDAVGHSPDRDCRNVGDIVKVPINDARINLACSCYSALANVTVSLNRFLSWVLCLTSLGSLL